MIERRKYQLNYIKKENQSGSYQGMRFTFLKKEDALVVIAYPEPYSLAATSEEKKTTKVFEFSQEGLDEAVEWLNALYMEKRDDWTNVVNQGLLQNR